MNWPNTCGERSGDDNTSTSTESSDVDILGDPVDGGVGADKITGSSPSRERVEKILGKSSENQ